MLRFYGCCHPCFIFFYYRNGMFRCNQPVIVKFKDLKVSWIFFPKRQNKIKIFNFGLQNCHFIRSKDGLSFIFEYRIHGYCGSFSHTLMKYLSQLANISILPSSLFPSYFTPSTPLTMEERIDQYLMTVSATYMDEKIFPFLDYDLKIHLQRYKEYYFI